MVTARTRQRIITALVVPFLLLVGTGAARAMFRCEYDQIAREACCCPEAQEPAETRSEAAFTKSCCCDLETVRSASPAEARVQVDRFELGQLHQALVVVFLDVPGPVESPAALRTPSVDAHPPAGPPLVLLKRSFLI